MKFRILLIALLAITGVSSAQVGQLWGRKDASIPLGRLKQYNRAVDYNVVTADSVANRIGLFTVAGCPDVIYVPLRNPAAGPDTVVFLQTGCVTASRTESIWLFSVGEVEDSTYGSTGDAGIMSTAQDTIFLDKPTTSSGGPDWFYLFRIR